MNRRTFITLLGNSLAAHGAGAATLDTRQKSTRLG
jgi:hypothetical protein